MQAVWPWKPTFGNKHWAYYCPPRVNRQSGVWIIEDPSTDGTRKNKSNAFVPLHNFILMLCLHRRQSGSNVCTYSITFPQSKCSWKMLETSSVVLAPLLWNHCLPKSHPIRNRQDGVHLWWWPISTVRKCLQVPEEVYSVNMSAHISTRKWALVIDHPQLWNTTKSVY